MVYKEKLCFLRKFFIIVGLLFVPLFLGLKSDNVSAVNLNTNTFDLYYRLDSNSSYHWETGITPGFHTYYVLDSGAGVQKYQFNTNSVQAGGNYAMLHFETNIVATNYRHAFNPWVNLYQQNILTCSTSSGVSITSKNLSWATTQWYDSQNQRYNNTLTYYGSVSMSGFTVGSNYAFTCQIGSTNYSFYDFGTDNSIIWFEQNSAYIEWTNNQTDNILNVQVSQNETIINQNQEFYNHEYEAEDNISNQSSGDIDNATNSQTTNIIGTIQNFATALGTVTTSPSGVCNITLPFPSFVGGDVTVNVCQRRGQIYQIISVGSSLLLIGFFIPFAYMVLKMIYNEIRSFTNG